MKYILIAVLAMCLFSTAQAASLTTVTMVTSGVSGVVCFRGAMTTPLAGGEIERFCTGVNGSASVKLPAWVTYRIKEDVPSGYAVNRVECIGAAKYLVDGPSATINVQDSDVTCTFKHVRRHRLSSK